jgi:hypothetical protein
MTDYTLKKLFEDVRRQDAENAPSFQRLLRTQRSSENRTSPSTWMPVALASVLLLAAVLAFSVLSKNSTLSPKEVEQWAAITDWSAPSDLILAENTTTSRESYSTFSDTLFEFAPTSTDQTQNL